MMRFGACTWMRELLSSTWSGRGNPLNVSCVESLMRAVLRGEKPEWPDEHDAELADAFLTEADYHGVQPLLFERLGASGWPSAILQDLRGCAVGRAMWELRHQQVVTEMLAALAAIGVEPVLFKGTALGYSLYPTSVLRARGDSDLIIPQEARASVDAALVALGFVRDLGVSGEFVAYQACYTREIDGEFHVLDLHWRINNSEVLARLFTHDELRRGAQGSPRLGPHALLASPVHALLLACMHRATHKQNPYYVDGVAHFGGDRLIWLYDIHLLAGSFTTAQWDEFVRLADNKGLRAVCLEGMERSRACFHTAYPEAVLAALARAGVAEPASLYLTGSRWRQQSMDFYAIEGSGDRVRFLGELLFPPVAYMRHKYPEARPDWLPWLYVRRASGGIFKRVFRSVD